MEGTLSFERATATLELLMSRRTSRQSTSEVLRQLRAYESANVTYIEPDGTWPMVWERARGVHVWNPEGRRYLDLTAAFGVAAAGHANSRVVRAGQKQMERLLHAMGDVHPHRLKAELARTLSAITFERWSKGKQLRTIGKTIFCNSGFEAVEAALKTASLATGKRGVIAFEGAYHGLGYGTLNVTHREHFKAPFRTQLNEFGCFLPFPTSDAALKPLERLLEKNTSGMGALLVEPIQARGGIRVPPKEFLAMVHKFCKRHEMLLICDEIYTGFGRTGAWFASEHSDVTPDIICLGKALTGGFPLSACVGRGDLMDAAWPKSSGEAIHTSTFLGHPVGCAMALAQIAEISERKLCERSAKLGKFLLHELRKIKGPSGVKLTARGVGLMAGLELQTADNLPATEICLNVIKRMLERGFILLPEGEHSNVISFTPPLTITDEQLGQSLDCLQKILQECA
ncbi:MAG TPA: aspartate aminotransferase family protein [Verrucomicrobiae bacterium]|jgi:4-aminobutyrate aminotransferase-like enzyme